MKINPEITQKDVGIRRAFLIQGTKNFYMYFSSTKT